MLRECPVTPYAADPSGGCGVSVSDSGREHGFGAPRLPALRSFRTARECPRPRLQRHAPRLGGFINPGGFPGRRVATRIRAAAASPFGLSEPASGQEWPVVPGAGRLPATSRLIAIAAPDCAFRRPRRLQPTTLPVAALWWRHHTTPSREPHGRSSYQSPCHHWPEGRFWRLSLPRSHQSAPATPAGEVTGGSRAGSPP